MQCRRRCTFLVFVTPRAFFSAWTPFIELVLSITLQAHGLGSDSSYPVSAFGFEALASIFLITLWVGNGLMSPAPIGYRTM